MEELLELKQDAPEFGLSVSERACTSSWKWNGSEFESVIVPEEDRRTYVRELTERTREIFKLGRGIAESFIEIGWQLYAVKEKSLYQYACIKAQEFSDIYDFAYKVFGFCKTTTVNLIGIVEQFGERGGPGLIKEWSGYSYSQLVELLPFASDERKLFTPAATVAEMREIRKGRKMYPLYNASGEFGKSITWETELKRIRAAEVSAVEAEAKAKAEKKAERPGGLLSLLSAGENGNGDHGSAFVEASAGEAVSEIVKDERYILRGKIMSGKLGLKNKHEREAWLLHLFEDHPEPYLDLPELRIKIWRYDFENGASLIIAGDLHDCCDILEPGSPDCAWNMRGYTRAQVVEWLTSHAKEV